jgi:hypothetical protein
MKTFDTYLTNKIQSEISKLREEKILILQQLNELDVGGAVKAGAGHVADVVKGALGIGEKGKDTDEISQSPEETKRKIDGLTLKMAIIKMQIDKQKMIGDGKDTTQIQKNIDTKQKEYDTKYGQKK